ncbi:putative FMN-binding regulatory protein PaiB [Neisseria perflava]|nr:putative FMN-binding regulatory protein PaiB [Neisseria perflava]MCP1771614.1 putative FMN-binding regulatory protein PaiB [Neisseria perflava]
MPDGEWLLIFQCVQHYISANWYPTKQETHKAVPTWNYQVVHAYAKATVCEDLAQMKAMLAELTAQSEQGEVQPWQLSDAPLDYIDAQCRGIVCVEWQITRLIGKEKLSQNQPAENREGVVKALRSQGNECAAGMADLVERVDKS